MSDHRLGPRLSSPGTTLPVRIELLRQLRRRRTQVTLGLAVLLPFILWIAFSVGNSSPPGQAGVSLTDLAQTSGPNFAVFALFSSASFLFVVVVALFFGDTVASEASWSSLRYLLAIPVPRVRLLRQKVIVAGLLSGTVLVAAPGGRAGARHAGLRRRRRTPRRPGSRCPTARRCCASRSSSATSRCYLAWVAGVSTLLSVSTDAPLGAVGGAVLVSILSQILDTIDALGSIRDALPTHYDFAWSDLLTVDVDAGDVVRGVLSGLVWATAFGATAVWWFRTKDITS